MIMDMDKLNKRQPGLVSDDLWDASIGKLNKNPEKYSLGYKTRIIHMIDSVSRGYITPMEAYDALKADYFPSFLEIRPSSYQHLIR